MLNLAPYFHCSWKQLAPAVCDKDLQLAFSRVTASSMHGLAAGVPHNTTLALGISLAPCEVLHHLDSFDNIQNAAYTTSRFREPFVSYHSCLGKQQSYFIKLPKLC